MTDISTPDLEPNDQRDEKLTAIVSHLYGHAVPSQGLDRAILPTITDPGSVPRPRRRTRLHTLPRYEWFAAAALVAAIVAAIGSDILLNSSSPSFASAPAILRRSAAALAPEPGTVTHREYTMHVPCAGALRCPDAIGEVWIANLNGTFLTYQVMRLTDVKGAAALPVEKHTSTVLPRGQGGGSTIATLAPTAWLRSVRRQLGWAKNVEPSEYLQAWSSLAEFNDYGAVTSQWIKHIVKSADLFGKVRRVTFEGAPSYRIQLPEQPPQATFAAIRTIYVDPRSYAIRGLEGLTCPVFGRTYSGSSFQYWAVMGCIQPRFVPKCFVNVGSGATYVWVPRGCATKVSPFQATLTASRTVTVCRAPRWVFGWYMRSHAGYGRCSGRKQAAAAGAQATGPPSGDVGRIAPATRSAPAHVSAAAPQGSVPDRRLQLGGSSWPQPRYNAARTAFDPALNAFTPANVSHLRLKWRRSQRYVNNFDLVAAAGLLFQGGTDGTSFVATNLVAHAVRWRFVPGGFVYSSPTVGQKLVFAPASAALYALDPRTGRPVWSYFPPRHGVISGTPIVIGALVVVPVCPPSQDENKFTPPRCSLYALSASTGRRLHVYSDPDGATPAIYRGRLYVTVQGTVRAFRLRTGRRLWSFPSPNDAALDIAVSGGIVYAAGNSSDTVYALDAATGRELWWFRAGRRHAQFTDVAIAYGRVFVGQIGRDAAAGLYCLDSRSGRVIWHLTDKYGFESGPTVANGVVYAADAAYPLGTLFALRASNGRRLWSTTVKHSGVASNPILTNGLLLVENGGRGVFAYGLPAH